MKAEITDTHVKCDEPGCGWSQPVEFDRLSDWHHKPCPKCGRGEIVSNEDVALMLIVRAAAEASDLLDPSGKLPRVDIAFDTAPMRAEQKGVAT